MVTLKPSGEWSMMTFENLAQGALNRLQNIIHSYIWWGKYGDLESICWVEYNDLSKVILSTFTKLALNPHQNIHTQLHLVSDLEIIWWVE